MLDFAIKAGGEFLTQKVEAPVDDTFVDVLFKAGLHLRLAARRSIKRIKDRVSQPGSPPYGPTDYLRNVIDFALDAGHAGVAGLSTVGLSCIVGPKLGAKAANKLFYSATPRDGKTVPQVLEEGGDISLVEFFVPLLELKEGVETLGMVADSVQGHWKRVNRKNARKAAGRPQRKRTVHIAARPYMNPALQKEQSYFLGLWKDSINKAVAAAN